MRLTEWKKDLVKANNEALYYGSMDDNSISADVVDQASSYTDKNVEMKAINRQIKLISEIDKALARIREGYLWILLRYRRANWIKKINRKTCCKIHYCSSRKA
jgi:DnaK suppressor protein